MSECVPVTMTLERGLQVLRAFRAERAALTNGELARMTGLSRATVSRLTTTLIHAGFIRRVAGGRQFELASGAFGIGQAFLATNPVAHRAHPVMQRMADRLDVSIALAVPDHLDMLYIAHCASARIATLRMGVGKLLPMGVTAIGRAWLWGLPGDERHRYVQLLADAAGPRAGQMKTGIAAAFEDLRQSGVCMSFGEYQRNVYGIALPVRIGRTGTLMSLSCGGAELQPDIAAIRDRVIPMLKAAAVELTERLSEVRYDL
ncbi:IclR family transcriptional regulator [Paraburkholderia sp.]|uniref:IclR family transcriptional regulator n=1 Tax=Paraburkholderia sp. TaxID=1926495 RepID=UPI0039E3358C